MFNILSLSSTLPHCILHQVKFTEIGMHIVYLWTLRLLLAMNHAQGLDTTGDLLSIEFLGTNPIDSSVKIQHNRSWINSRKWHPQNGGHFVLTNLTLMHIYASVNWINIDLGNGLSPVRRLNQCWCWLIVKRPLRNALQWERFKSKCKTFYSRKCISKCRLRNGGHYVQGLMC